MNSPVFSISELIKMGDISYSLLPTESDQDLIVLTKSKALLEGGPQLYTQNTTAQGLVIKIEQSPINLKI